jgi:hypothetical protein
MRWNLGKCGGISYTTGLLSDQDWNTTLLTTEADRN